MKNIKKTLSLILSVIMFFGVFSSATTVFAEDYNEYVENKEYRENLLTETIDEESEKAEILYEVTEKREKYSKTYKRADGSYTTVFSETPVHTYENGEWKDIDNTLKTEAGVIKNTDGIFEVEFPETISENEKITVTNDGESLAFSVNGIESGVGVTASDEGENTDAVTEDLSRTVSEIIYKNVDENTDIQYIVSSNSVKENIIVNNKENIKPSYSFEIEKGNLDAVLDEGNNLRFLSSDNEEIFCIPAPVMNDSGNAVSYDISVSVEEKTDETLILSYTPSEEWLKSDERVYPVIIDPVIAIPDSDENIIEDTVIINERDNPVTATTNYSDSAAGYIVDTDYRKSEVLVKFNMDCFSSFKNPNILITDFNFIASGYAVGGNILAKPVNGSWDSKTITYNDVYPSDNTEADITYENSIIDYYTGVSSETTEPEYTCVNFNITDIFNEWLSGERGNNGFVIVPENENAAGILLIGGGIEVTEGVWTYNSFCTVDYVDTSCGSDNYEYISQDIGRAGTTYVNTLTRGLSLRRSDLSMNGLRMPADIGFNFEGAYNNFIIAYTDILNATGEEVDYFMPYGEKWLPSYMQLLMCITPGQYQVFTDKGTVAVFNLKEETVTDEETGESETTVIFEEDESGDTGYTLELIDQAEGENPENFKLITPTGETTYFDEAGFAYEIHEAEANADGSYDKITIARDSDNLLKIDSVTDGVGRKYIFNYDTESGLLSEISCKTAEGTQIKAGTTDVDLKVSYSYNENGELSGVTYPDGKTVTYTYDLNGNLIKAQNIDNYNIQYTYDSLGKVTNIAEYADTTAGNSIHLNDLGNRQVKVIDAYSGTETYQFGRDGRLHYTFDEKGNYYKSDYATSNDENVYSSYDWRIASENLLKNGSFEDVSEQNSQRGKHWSSFERVESETAYNGSYVYKISSDKAVTKYVEQTVEVKNIVPYTVSAYVKSQVAGALTLKISATDSGSTVDTAVTKTVTTAEDWTKISLTYIPDNFEVSNITVSIGFEKNMGEYYVDCVQLESGKGTAEYNLIENGSFNNGNEKWSEASVTTETLNGKSVNAVKLNGGLPYYTQNTDDTYAINDNISAVTQNVKIDGKKGDIYSVGGWFKGSFDDNYLTPDSGITYEQLTNSSAQLKVTYNYTETVTTTDEATSDTTTTEQTVTENFVVDFAPNNSGWQYAVDSFALKGDTESVDITVMAKNITEDSFVTGVELYSDDDAIYFGTDEEVEEESSETETESETTEEEECPCENCEEFDCACRCLSESVCNCVQCKRKSDTETVSEDGKTVTTSSFDGEKYMQSAYTYSDDMNYIVSETDSNGISNGYAYNVNGSLTSFTDGAQKATTCQTNAVGYLTLAETNVTGLTDNAVKMALSYVYDGDLLTTVNQGNVEYIYTYDGWGQLKSVKVDGETLVSYNYGSGAYRTRVTEIIFGDTSDEDFTVKYTYSNSTGEITKVKKYITVDGEEDAIIYNYEYDNLGNLTAIRDDLTGHRISYTDTGVVISDIDTNEIIYKLEDVAPEEDGEEASSETVENEPVSITAETVGDVVYNHKIYDSSYDAVTGKTTEKEAVTGGKTIGTQTVSDWFGRSEAVTVMTKDPTDSETTDYAAITSEYGYKTENGVTTNLISSLNNSFGINDYVNYGYTYDNNGRITGITASSNVDNLNSSTQYIYDEAGQLISQITSSVTTEYTYDSKGNITSRKVGSANPVTFTYGENNWEDRLTGYNGKTITYDGIGNPTSYLGATLSWRGRELATYEKGNKQITYSYDVDGMRYQKIVKTDGVEAARYDYVYSDGTLVLITYTVSGTATTARFIYDCFGEPRGFILNNSALYLYLKNAQGDIAGVVDENGEIILTYIYDAWGNVNFSGTSMSNMALALTLSNVNPFTYRGYCYDFDIEMYYLQSRYYDPQICRFINADSTDYLGATGTLLSYNLFAYCENDAVDFVDFSGCKKKEKKPKTLQKYIKEKYNKLSTTFGNSKLKIKIKDNSITITANFSFSGGLEENRLYISNRRYETYSRTFLFGIESYWAGTFTVWGYKVKLKTTASAKDTGIKVYMYSYTAISNVKYPKNGWKRNSFGTVSMYKGDPRNKTLYYSYDDFKWVSAHEFGHLLGVNDAYTKNVNVISIFNKFGTKVQNVDVEKVLRAFIHNQLQEW